MDTAYKDLHDVIECRNLLSAYRNDGAGLLLVSVNQMTPELHQAVNGFVHLPLAIQDVQSEYDMYHALSYNPRMIITDRPDALYDILFNGDHIDFEHYDSF